MTTDLAPAAARQTSLMNFMRLQFFYKPKAYDGPSLAGKSAIITGANTGLGFETARQLLASGLNRLILAVRSEEKGMTAAAILSSAHPHATIEVWQLDLSVYESIVAFAKRADKELDRLDFVNLNAGIAPAQRAFNETTGHDEVVQVNYLSTALLAILLLPVMHAKDKSHPARMTFTSSEMPAWTKFQERTGTPLLGELDKPGNVDMMDRMVVSKLLCQFLVKKLAEVVDPAKVVINAASPAGLCDSEFFRDQNNAWWGPIGKLMLRLAFNNCATGAHMMTDALLNHGAEVHGQFLSLQRLTPMAPIIYTSEGKGISDRLWNETVDELAFANVKDLVRAVSNVSSRPI